MDQLPLSRGPFEPAPAPRLPALSLLIGRVMTIKLTYWLLLTAVEATLPVLDTRPFADRLPLSIVVAVAATVLALTWARVSARAIDAHAVGLHRSLPAVLTAFAVGAVVGSPASLPLLLIERQRSLDGCGGTTCHPETIVLWAALFAAGTLLIPLAFAASLRPAPRFAA